VNKLPLLPVGFQRTRWRLASCVHSASVRPGSRRERLDPVAHHLPHRQDRQPHHRHGGASHVLCNSIDSNSNVEW